MKNSSAWTDGVLYVALAMLTQSNTALGSDDAAKWLAPVMLYWLKFGVGVMGAGALALKMYRSTAFADSRNKPTQTNETTNGNGGTASSGTATGGGKPV